MAKKPKRKFFTDSNCQLCGSPYERKAGLHVCPKCGHMRSLDYEANPYYSRINRDVPRADNRKLPTNGDDDYD